jgi:hypothetical protein
MITDVVRTATLRAGTEWRPTAGRVRATLGRHRLFCAVTVLAIVPRVFAMIGFQPALLFRLDTFDYLWGAVRVAPNPINPSGYSLFLWLLRPFHSLALIAGLQHVMGLAIAAMVYLVLYRRGVAAWLATLAAVPVLFEPGQLVLEHLIMSDLLAFFLMMASLTLLLLRRMPTAARSAAAGALMGAAALVRPTVLLLIILLPLYLLAVRGGWRRAGAALLAGVIPVAGYGLWFATVYGQFGLTNSDGLFLWSRTMSFAHCSVIRPPAHLRPLCPEAQPGGLGRLPVAKRPVPRTYLWQHDAWMWRDSPPAFAPDASAFTPANNQRARDFAVRAIKAQPLGYLGVVARGTYGSFTSHYLLRFPRQSTVLGISGRFYSYALGSVVAYTGTGQGLAHYLGWQYATRAHQPFAYLLREYQAVFHLPGVVVAVILLLGLAGIIIPRRRTAAAVLMWLSAVITIVLPVAVHEYDPRYLSPAIPLGCMAAALAFRDRRRDSLRAPVTVEPVT